ncbi:hypothetical protein KKB99_03465 [bacterium]|nr:hypothetical protein [bacterium]MBU1025049.1 hypothetical protein [bacterium]
MYRIIFFITVFISVCGCSANPQLPEIPDPKNISDNYNQLLGTWEIEFNSDLLEATIIPNRELSAHYNVLSLIPTPILTINSFDPITKILDVDVSISNPFAMSAYDIRGVLFTDNFGHTLIDPDGLTDLFDPPVGDDINPFMAYGKNNPNREFPAFYTESQNYKVYIPADGPVNYMIEGSWPGNCPEPYSMENFIQTPGLTNSVGSQSHLDVDILDWQNNVDSVSINAFEITNELESQFTQMSAESWGIDLTNNTGLAAGDYSCLISSTSSDSASLAQYKYVTVNVAEDSGKAKWSFLVYLHESNLGQFALQDINEMEVVGSIDGEMNVIVLWDKEDNPNDIILKIAKDPNGNHPNIISPTVDDFGEVIPPGGLDMADGVTVERFLRWAIREYPADHYALDFWDHGDGPFSLVPERGFVKSVCQGLQMWEIRDACQAVLNENPGLDRLDFIGFDACLMAWLETGYCLRNVTYAGLGSEMLEPGNGWHYTPFLQNMHDNIQTYTCNELCTDIVNSYLDSAYNGDTLSSWRSDYLVDNVIPALNDFSTQLISAVGTNRSAIRTCYNQADDWGDSCRDVEIKDLGYFAQRISGASSLPTSLRNSATSLINSIDGAMIHHDHNGGGSGCSADETGWQIWFPDDYNAVWWSSYRSDYVRLEFTDTLWEEWLGIFDS